VAIRASRTSADTKTRTSLLVAFSTTLSNTHARIGQTVEGLSNRSVPAQLRWHFAQTTRDAEEKVSIQYFSVSKNALSLHRSKTSSYPSSTEKVCFRNWLACQGVNPRRRGNYLKSNLFVKEFPEIRRLTWELVKHIGLPNNSLVGGNSLKSVDSLGNSSNTLACPTIP
jgi:hypothetical protein